MPFHNEHLTIVESFADGSPRVGRMHEKGALLREIRWHENGRVAESTDFAEGQFHGSRITWFEDGCLKTETEFKAGVMEGRHREWHPGGLQVKEESHWRDGQLHGPFHEWHLNGRLRREATLKEGKGLYSAYNEEGKKTEEYEMAGPVRHGRSVLFLPDGRSVESQWLNGTEVGLRRADRPVNFE